jgi:hypothetical protein
MAYEDLLKDTSESKDDGNYFLVTITDLDLGTAYPLQFRWKNKNGTLGAWSSVKTFVSESATVPSEPNLGSGDVVGGAGFIKVTWDGNNALAAAASNFDRVNVHISGSTFGDGTKPAGFFKQAGTQTFAAVAGVYIVQLKILTVNGSESLFSTARTVTVTSAAPAAESSVTPSTPTVSSVLGAIQLSWNGKTSSGGDQPFGFNAAKVYVGTSAGFTPSSSNQVDVLNFANGQNTLNIGVGTIVNSVALDYGIDYYIKIATTNGTDTSTPVSATGNPVRVGQVTSGDIVTVTADKIATGTLSSGSTITVGSTSGKHIKLSGTGDPFIIYGSGGVANPVLSYNGAKLTVVGDGTFTGDISGATGTLTNALNVGTISSGLYPFSVSSSGVMRAISGTIGGLTLAADAIQNAGNTFRLDSSGVIRAGSSGGNSIIISPSLGIYHSTNGTSANGYFALGPSSGTIAGWTLASATLSAGNLTLNSNGTITTTNLTIYDTGRILNSGGFEVTAAGALIATGATISGAITATSGSFAGSLSAATGTFAGALSAATGTFAGALSAATGTFAGALSAASGTFTGSLTTNGTAGGYANNTLTIAGGKLSADKVIYLQTDISTGVIDVLGSIIYLEAPTEITGSVRASASATFGVTGSLFEFLSSSGNVRVAQTYNNAVSGRSMQISSAGMYGTTASTRRKKHEIESYRINSEALLNLDVKAFKYKPEIDQGQQQQHGFIAEDAQELGLNELIQYDSNGIPDYFAYEKLPIFLLQLIQEQDASINAMQARLDALEG